MRRRNLTLSEWGDAAQIVTALAVVVSLVYVAYEIRENTEATRGATRLAMAEQDLADFSARLDPGVVARAEATHRAGSELSAVERLQLRHHQQMNFRIFENAFYQFRRGLLAPAVWERFRAIVRLHLEDDPYAVEMWDRLKQTFTRDFREEVEALAATSTASANPR